MANLKIQDLGSVQHTSESNTLYTLLMHADYSPRIGQESSRKRVVVHIADRYGIYGADGQLLRRVTRCNRVANMWHIWKPQDIESGLDTGDWKLCRRCGTQEDFEEALGDYQDGVKEANERRRIEAGIEKALRYTRLAKMEAELDNFEQAYITPDAPLVEQHSKTGRYGRVYSAGDFEVWVQIVNPEVK